LAKLAARIMAGQTLEELNFTSEILPKHYSVKEAVFPFIKFPGVDVTLGPEMRSTGEVMGIDVNLGIAYAKAQMSAQPPLPTGGNVFISVKDSDKRAVVPIAREFDDLGFTIYATGGTARVLNAAGVQARLLYKLKEGRPNILDLIKNGDMHFIINTPSGQQPRRDEVVIRSAAVAARIAMMTTLRGAQASSAAIRALKNAGYAVKSLQEYHRSG
jgi:carbamoyl-phosphate synthase large subunit